MARSKRTRKNRNTSTAKDIKHDIVKDEKPDQKPSMEISFKKTMRDPKKEVNTKSSRGSGRLFKSGIGKREKAARGVVFISSLPHGFYEKQLEGYFGQFGKVTGIYVPKSKKTGKAKGYAFVEFLQPEVAQIAAETMNNYLMFNRLIKTTVIPPEEQRPHMFSDRFKQMEHRYSDFNIAKELNQKQTLLVKKKDSCVTRSVRKLNRLQEHLQSLGVDYKIKVAGLHEAVTLTGIKTIDPENNNLETCSKEEKTSKGQETASKKKKGKQKTKVSQVVPTPSVKVEAKKSSLTTVALPSSTSGKRSSGRSMVKAIAKQQLTAGKEKVAKLVKTIKKSKLSVQKSNLKNTVKNLQQRLETKKKKAVPSTSKMQVVSLPSKKPAPSPMKKKRNTHSKLETTV